MCADNLQILQINIEGLSATKSDYLSHLCQQHNIDVILLEELHIATEEQLSQRGTINGFVLAGYVLHPIYGVATYVKSSLSDWRLISNSDSDGIFRTTIQIGSIKILNVYKPPSLNWPDNVLDTFVHPAVYMGDFNCHNTAWGYDDNDFNGEVLLNWSLVNNLHLMFDAKDKATFRSARWRRDYNPDLCFVTMDRNRQPLFSNRKVLDGFPRSQHRPVILSVGLSIPFIQSVPKPRWNFKKADWQGFTKAMDANIRFIPPISSNYDRFVKLLISTAKKFIPRGFREKYIPGWSDVCEDLFQLYQENHDPEIGNSLLNALNETRNNDWSSLMQSLDFKHSSRKSWALLRKLDVSSSRPEVKSYNCNVNSIASRLVKNSKVSLDRQRIHDLNVSFKQAKSNLLDSSDSFCTNFTVEEVSSAIGKLKSSKAAGLDGIFNEFFMHFGSNCIRWLSNFFSNILFTGVVPATFLRSKVISILKPGKSGDLPEHFRPISLLSISYKLLERLIFNRIADVIYDVVPHEQAGFRPNRNCCDQVLSLTSFIESGFHKKLKTGVVFIDLSAAYDTVWRKGLLFKLLNVIPSLSLINLINNMLCNRRVQVFLGDNTSRTRRLNDGLPQGSVLAPLLFILYLSDLPVTTSLKFIYADDIVLAVQHNKFEEVENHLSADLQILWSYFKNWRLKPNISKTEVNIYHLTNCLSDRIPQVFINDVLVQYNPVPKYLGVLLDRSLTYKQHIECVRKKLKSRTNIIRKLAGTTWGANFHTLRTSSLALVFSVGEYCCPVWLNSHHTSKIDVELHNSLRIITGCVASTPLPWLYVLSNIAPPFIRRQDQMYKIWAKVADLPQLLCHQIIINQPSRRLCSRNPSYQTGTPFFNGDNFDVFVKWNEYWSLSAVVNHNLVVDVSIPVSGFDLHRRLWVTLNRIRTGHGCCGSCLFNWKFLDSPACDCGFPMQSMNHIVMDCPFRLFPGGLQQLNLLSPEAIFWLENLDLNL